MGYRIVASRALDERFEPGTAVMVTMHPTTRDRFRQLGMPRTWTWSLPLVMAATIESEHVVFYEWRSWNVIWHVPIAAVREVSVAEVVGGLRREVALAIWLDVVTPDRHVHLPIVPLSDEGRTLIWQEREVRALARRLTPDSLVS